MSEADIAYETGFDDGQSAEATHLGRQIAQLTKERDEARALLKEAGELLKEVGVYTGRQFEECLCSAGEQSEWLDRRDALLAKITL